MRDKTPFHKSSHIYVYIATQWLLSNVATYVDEKDDKMTILDFT